MNILAIIPARGGSKGIPGKNIQKVGGKPLISRTINAALSSKLITRIIVSTDDELIAEIATNSRVEVVQRPSEISGDLASSEDALLHVLKILNQNEKYTPEIIVFLQCTSPFTTSNDIDSTINKLIDTGSDSVLAVAEFHHFLWLFDEVLETAVGINHNDQEQRKRRQDIQTQYIEAGSVYAMKTSGFIKNKKRFFGKISMNVIPNKRVLEIDNPLDLTIADLIQSEI